MALLEHFKTMNEFQKRVVSAAILAPIVLLIVFIGGVVFNIFVLLLALLMAFEWNDMVYHKAQSLKGALLKKWRQVGIVYVTVFAASCFYLMGDNEEGRGALTILFVLLIVWVTDIAAYFCGKIIGGPKLWPAISPKKTWAGFVGGVLAAVVVGGLAAPNVLYNLWQMILLSAFLSVLSQGGDFFESWVKRQFGVKDSGELIPGHGGVLDRADGFVVAAPVFVLVTMFGGSLF